MRSASIVIAAGLLSACAVTPAPAPAPGPPQGHALPEEEPVAAPDAAPVAPIAIDPAVAERAAIETATTELQKRRITLYRPLHKDGKQLSPSEGYLAPVAPIARGFIYSGLLDRDGTSAIVIGMFDADWQEVWQLEYPKKGFVEYEGGQVAEDADGNIVAFVPSYVTPSTVPTYRLVKLTADGKIIWELQLVRDKWGNTPQIHLGKLTADGAIELRGHIYQGKPQKTDRPALRWTATITRDGKLADEAVGEGIDWAKDDW